MGVCYHAWSASITEEHLQVEIGHTGRAFYFGGVADTRLLFIATILPCHQWQRFLTRLHCLVGGVATGTCCVKPHALRKVGKWLSQVLYSRAGASGEALFPKNINDVKAAIRWIKANAKKYHFNANKVAVWGGSAGGNLSALAGTSADVKKLEDLSLGNANYSSRVRAVVDWFGAIDFLAMDGQLTETGNGKPDHNDVDSPESKVSGRKITEIPEIVKETSPETYLTNDDPPFFIEHGTKDHLVPTQQSIKFAKKVESVLGKDKVRLLLLEGSKHGGPAFETPENLKLVFDFLDSHLK